jgi:hypothetical protein
MKKITFLICGLLLSSLSYAQVLRDYTFPDANSVTASQVQITTPATPVAFDNVEKIANANDAEASFSYNADGNGTGALELSAVNPNDAGKNYSWRINAANLNYNGATAFTVSFDIKRVGVVEGTNIFAQVLYPLVGTDGSGTVTQNNLPVTETYQTITFEVDDPNFAPDEAILLIDFGLAVGAVSGFGGTILVDNITITDNTPDPSTDATLSDLTLDGVTIDGFSPETTTYDVELPNGTATAPTVAGVATQAGSGSSAVDVTQAVAIPGAATVEVTAPNGTDSQTYTVNFTEAEALPPAAPTPTESEAIAIISDAYSNITTPQVDVFGGTLTNFDLNTDGNEEARLINGGSGFQFNYFPGDAFVDISAPAMMHFDFYCDNLADGDILRVRLLGSNTAITNIARATFTAAQSGTWVGVDLMIPDGTVRNDFDDVDSSAGSIDVTDLALIQFNTLDLGSTLAGKDVYLSNIYFYGGTLSNSDFNFTEFSVKPNPTSNIWTVTGQNQINKIEVFDILGKTVLSLQPNEMEVQLDATSLKSGLYLARIASEQGVKTIKLVKE